MIDSQVDYFRLFVGRSGTADISIAAKDNSADVLFIDVEILGSHTDESVAAALRKLGDEVASHDFTIVRSPFVDPSSQLVSQGAGLRLELAKRLRLQEGDTEVAVLSHCETGEVTWVGADALRSEVGDLARWACASEIRSLIDHYCALTISDDVQFVLPSSQASNSFLRISDILRTRRDIEIVARWVYRNLHPVGEELFTLATDASGLLPVLLVLEDLLRSNGAQIAQSIVSGHYPFGAGDADSLLLHVGSSAAVVYLLSVSRTGGFEDLILQSLNTSLGPKATAVVTVVADMRGEGNIYEGRVRRNSLAEVVPPDDADPADLAGRPTVAVEAETFNLRPEFDAKPVSFPRLPDDDDSSFFSALSTAQAVGVECSPYKGLTSVRPRSRLLSFRIFLEQMSGAVVDELESRDDVRTRIEARVSEHQLASTYDVVAIPRADAEASGPSFALVDRLLRCLNISAPQVVSVDELAAISSPPKRALLLLWGSVTGASVIRSARAVREVLAPTQLDGLVVHFRPPSVAEIEHARRAFSSGSLVALWEHSVPWESAFASEAAVLSRWMSASLRHQKWLPRVMQRLEVISPSGDSRSWEQRTSAHGLGGSVARQLLWVEPSQEPDPMNDEVPTWLHDTPTAMLAAAARLQSLRIQHERMGGARLSIGDCVASEPPEEWVAAVVRNARPGELWFGIRQAEQSETASHLCDWISSSSAMAVLGELLAADALGKVPSVASNVIREFAADQDWADVSAIPLLLDLTAWSRKR